MPQMQRRASVAIVADLRCLLDPALPVWMLVDPMAREPLGVPTATADSRTDLQAARERLWQRPITAIELPANIELPLSRQPYLVSLEGTSDACLDESIELSLLERAEARVGGLSSTGRAAFCFGGWLQGDLRAAQAAAQVATMARLNVPRGVASARYLRVADPRTLDFLLCVLGREQCAGAVTPLRRWHWVDSCCRLEGIDVREDTTSRAIEIGLPVWRRFATSPLVHPTLARWLGELDARGSPWEGSTIDALQRCEAALEQASTASRRHRDLFQGNDDYIAWAVVALLLPGFDTDERWQAFVAEAADPKATFNVMCHAVPERMASPAHPTP